MKVITKFISMNHLDEFRKRFIESLSWHLLLFLIPLIVNNLSVPLSRQTLMFKLCGCKENAGRKKTQGAVRKGQLVSLGSRPMSSSTFGRICENIPQMLVVLKRSQQTCRSAVVGVPTSPGAVCTTLTGPKSHSHTFRSRISHNINTTDSLSEEHCSSCWDNLHPGVQMLLPA